MSGSAMVLLAGMLAGCAPAGIGVSGTGPPAPEPSDSSPAVTAEPTPSLPATPAPGPSASADSGERPTPSNGSGDGGRAVSGADGYVWPQPGYPASGDLGAGAPCRFDVLDVSLLHRPHDSGAGSFYADIVFLNYSDVECTLRGYPAVAFVDDAGGTIGPPATQSGASSPALVLSPGGTATARLHFTQAGAYGCEMATATGLRVRAPGLQDATFLPYRVDTCADDTSTVTVSPVIAPTS